MMADIEGTVVSPDVKPVNAENLPAQPAQQALFNPLDADPEAFSRALQSRQENYDALAQHLRAIMVPGVDFGRIHHDKNCPDGPYRCKNERHWTPYDLWSPGADKILGVLNLGAVYPGVEDYKRAALKGMPINDVIVDCEIDNGRGQVIAQGMGACSRTEGQIKGDLNRCIKRACKRARVDAVKRLPTVASLFEDQAFWRQLDEQHKAGQRAQRPQGSRRWNTGARLEEWPFQKPPELVGVKFVDMKDSTIDWILAKMQNKPDIYAAAQRVRESRDTVRSGESLSSSPAGDAAAPDARRSAEGSADDQQAGPATQGTAATPAQSTDDWLDEFDNYPESP